jgi:putative toxin-antitoxin system antitoxin component (TIGR02293 family)
MEARSPRAEHHARADLSRPEESVYRRAGRLLGLSTPLHSEIDLTERLEKGLSVKVLESLRTRVGLTDAEIYELIAPRRTLERRAALGRPLSSEEADRAVRIARIAAQAQRAFAAQPHYVQEWLRAPQPALRARAPLQALKTASGARAVEDILLGIRRPSSFRCW